VAIPQETVLSFPVEDEVPYLKRLPHSSFVLVRNDKPYFYGHRLPANRWQPELVVVRVADVAFITQNEFWV
jgi:hypothetical protein